MSSRSVRILLATLALALYSVKPAYAHDKEEGTVVKAGEGKLTLTGKGGQTHTREVAKDAPVTLDGKPAKLEDLKDGRSFAETAKRVSTRKPVVVLKAGRTDQGAKAASSHTGALAGNDRVYDDILKQSGVIRAPGLNDLLEYARGIPLLATPKGENVVIITGAGGSGVLLSDACVDNGLSLMTIPDDLDAAFRKFIPPFGAAGNPVDITGGEPPSTYRNTIALGLADDRIHSLILGYWHTIVTPPMVFAKLVVDVVEEYRANGIHKPVVASLAGDVQVEEASEYLYRNGVVAYPYTTEKPVAILGAKYRWARAAGLLG